MSSAILEDEYALKRESLARANELRMLYQQLPLVVTGHLVSGLLLTLALYIETKASAVVSWYLVLALAAGYRLFLFWRFRALNPQGEALLAWERPFSLALYTTSAAWGIGVVIIMPDSLAHQLLVLFFLVLTAGGAFGVYSPLHHLLQRALLLLLTPVIVWLALQNSLITYVVMVALVLFLLLAVRASRLFSDHIHQSFVLTLLLDGARSEAERIARVDDLTGLSNRRAFIEEGKTLRDYCARHGGLLAMILVDVDHFKKINDNHGHANGDLVLKKVAQILRQTVRSSDICARIGGEEFGVLLRISRLEDMVALAQKLRWRVARTPIVLNENSRDPVRISVTASFGAATGSLDLDELFRTADNALYQAKEKGRNKVVYATCFSGDELPDSDFTLEITAPVRQMSD